MRGLKYQRYKILISLRMWTPFGRAFIYMSLNYGRVSYVWEMQVKRLQFPEPRHFSSQPTVKVA